MKKLFFIFNLPLLLAGCIALKNNVALTEPTVGERARIRVVIPSVFNNYRGVTGYPNSQCSTKTSAGQGHVVSSYPFGFEKNSNGQKIGIPATRYSEEKDYVKAEVYLSANQPTKFSFLMPASASKVDTGLLQMTTYYNGCVARIILTPKANADYELVFPSKESCEFELNRLGTDKGDVSAIPVPANDVEICD